MARPRICLIATGGTIGIVRDGGVLRPPADSAGRLEIAPEIGRIADVSVVPLLNKDSVNMAPGDWTAIAAAIHARLGREYGFDGFVVTHGTDTAVHRSRARVCSRCRPAGAGRAHRIAN
jgi:L-asparaginase